MLDTPLATAAQCLLPEAVALRRAIHAEPEVGLDLPLTRAKVLAALEGLPLEIREGPSTSGLVAILHGANPGRRVLLRGDMDALPLTEDTGLEFASRFPGVMHACGHDLHVAMLAGAARLLSSRRDSLNGTVMFMFQPGEEGFHGARFMIEDGLLAPFPDLAFAIHVSPSMPLGVFTSRSGVILAASDRFRILVRGRGGHASMPSDAVDPVPIACELVLALQSLVARRIPIHDPAVLSVTRISAGSADNVIPEDVELRGTIRSLSEAVRAQVHRELPQVACSVAAAHGAEAECSIAQGFPATICNKGAVALACRVSREIFGEEAWVDMPTPLMASEDFSYVLENIPGAMIFLGAAPTGADFRTCCALHSNQMIVDENIMARGIALHCALAEAALR